LAVREDAGPRRDDIPASYYYDERLSDRRMSRLSEHVLRWADVAEDSVHVYAKRGLIARVLYLLTALVWYALTGGGRIGRGSVVVLCYHGVSREQRQSFVRQMSEIAPRAIALAELGQAGAYRWGVPPRVCVTFDDGFENLLENAVPVLERLRVPATVFVVPRNWGRCPVWQMTAGHPEAHERLMDERQIRSLLQNRGFQVGSHTSTHTNLLSLSTTEVQRELSESKAVLENTFNVSVSAVAFPYGACNDRIIHEAQQAGYLAACTLEPRLHRRGQEHRIGRFSMSPEVWPLEFRLTCAGAYAWLYVGRRLLAVARARWAALAK
jgi:peptidoglycan/xylan/chitin deacetylase (PgdA/CDA1 family)